MSPPPCKFIPSIRPNQRTTHPPAQAIVAVEKLLQGLGDLLPRSKIDLSLRIADIDACLNAMFHDFRLYTMLRCWTRFLAGELRLPRLSRYAQRLQR